MWLRHLGEDGGIQFGRPFPAGDLGSYRRSCRRPDDEIGVGHIDPGIGQAGDETEFPGIACSSAAGENQGSLVRVGRLSCGVDLLVGHRPIPVPWRSRRGDAIGCGRRANARRRRRCCVHGSRPSWVACRALPLATTSVARSWTAGEHPSRILRSWVSPPADRSRSMGTLARPATRRDGTMRVPSRLGTVVSTNASEVDGRGQGEPLAAAGEQQRPWDQGGPGAVPAPGGPHPPGQHLDPAEHLDHAGRRPERSSPAGGEIPPRVTTAGRAGGEGQGAGVSRWVSCGTAVASMSLTRVVP